MTIKKLSTKNKETTVRDVSIYQHGTLTAQLDSLG